MKYAPPNGPKLPPECSNTQPLAHCCALSASVLFQTKAEAPCWALTVLWSERYSLISLEEVDPTEELLLPLFVEEAAVVVVVRALEDVVTGLTVVLVGFLDEDGGSQPAETA